MNGLIHALKFDGKGRGEPVELDNLARTKETCWLHFDYRDPDTTTWFQEESGIDTVVIESLLAEETRPRALTIEDGLLLAFRGVNLNPGSDPEDMVSIRMWITANRIFSTRARRLLSVTDTANNLEKGTGPKNTAELLLQLMGRLVDRINDCVNDFEDRVAAIEEKIIEGETERSLRTDLSNLRRQIIAIRRYLAPQREAFTRVATENVSWLTASHRILTREITDRLVRQIEDLDAVRDRATVAHEELVARISEQANNRMYLLSIVAAIFLPLGFLTGLLGINVGGIPGSDNPYAFGIFSLALIIIVTLQIIYFRRNRWL